MIKEEKHAENVQTLLDMEQELVDLISITGNNLLQAKFLQWQDQRNKCNDGYLEILEEICG